MDLFSSSSEEEGTRPATPPPKTKITKNKKETRAKKGEPESLLNEMLSDEVKTIVENQIKKKKQDLPLWMQSSSEEEEEEESSSELQSSNPPSVARSVQATTTTTKHSTTPSPSVETKPLQATKKKNKVAKTKKCFVRS